MTDDALLRIETAEGSRQVRLGDYLSLAEIEQADRDAIAWIKRVRVAEVAGRPLREQLTYRGESLWWFVEIYLHRMRVIETLHRAVTATENLFRTERPRSVTLVEGDPIARSVIEQGARRHGAAWHGASCGAWFHARRFGYTLAKGALLLVQALVSHVRIGCRPPVRPAGTVAVAAFVHTAFWRSTADREAYVGPVLRELVACVPPERLVFVGLGPRTVFRARTMASQLRNWKGTIPDVQSIEAYAGLGATRGALRYGASSVRVCRQLWQSADLRRAAVIGGYRLWPFIRHELAGVACLQLPWSVRVMDEIAAALDRVQPRVALTYAEAGGWGRALVVEARRRGIPVCGIQHGFIHRHWMNYLHEPDEMAPAFGMPGFPRPDLTLLFDRFAMEHLVTRGAFPSSSLDIMGNPRLDELAAAAREQTDQTRLATREHLGVDSRARVVLLATKYRERAHAALLALFEAVRSMPGVHLVVRCHPAETPDPYLALARGAPTISVAPSHVDLVSSLAVSDLVVTVNSTVALEAMALGIPALALNLPNYLSPLVEAGVMYGAEATGQVEAVLQVALADDASRVEFRARQQAFMAKYDMLPSGTAANRAVRAILTLADSTGR
ncbi:MAG: hypothetical protein WCP29_09800 [Acidobacteriota bacterium]